MSEGTIKDWMEIDEYDRLLDAIQKIRKKIQWKPGKDTVHLKKRHELKQLPLSASLLDYEKIVNNIVENKNNALYLYEVTGNHHYTFRGFAQDKEWLVIFGQGGVMETAFPPRKSMIIWNAEVLSFLGSWGRC
jgi:hypothetical protein